MLSVTIDNRTVEVEEGATVLEAAGRLGIEIPTMCYLEGLEAATSCMLCVVKIEGKGGLVPACGAIVQNGMSVQSECDEVRRARKTALELLLSDHLGDCLGPCQVICPAGMNIPLMIRQIVAGDLAGAIATVKKDIALPGVLGRICPGPCEKGCRRSQFDQAVSICLLKRYVADVDLQSSKPYLPVCEAGRNKRVAIIGGGPGGLAGAYYLLQMGYSCTIFDDHEKLGGALRYGLSDKELDRDVLDKEIGLISQLGLEFRGTSKVGTSISMEDLRRDFDAVFVATGKLKGGDDEGMGLTVDQKGIVIDRQTYQTNMPGVFAGGDAVGARDPFYPRKRRRKWTRYAAASSAAFPMAESRGWSAP